MPRVGDIITFEEAIKAATECDVNIFFEPSGVGFQPLEKTAKKVGIFIGPEGGWMDNEIDAAKKAGFKIVSLGPLIMKAETAVVIASYLAAH